MNRSALDEVKKPQNAAAEDQDVLYDMLDRALARIEEGLSVDFEDLLSGHENLRERAMEMVRLASRVGVGSGPLSPVVPGYSLMGELGQGGMGAVYLARQERIGGRLVALKVLPPASGLSQRARRRFSGEALAIGRLRHPNIVAIHDVIDEPDVLAYAMEWVDGPSLAQMIRDLVAAGNQPDIGFVCRLGINVARALAAVHRAGLVHRDVKPSNILIRGDGTPLLSDFGLVRDADSTMTRDGQFAGTVGYASPEQHRGEQNVVDARSDVYSLGVTLFYALGLRLPYDAAEPGVMLREIERGPRTTLRRANPRVPRDLETIVSKAMDGDRARRYATADELADDLERLMSFQPIRAVRPRFRTRAWKLVRRNRAAAWGIIAGAFIATLICAGVVMYTYFLPDWVAMHVREARLALLDPEQGTAVFNYVFWDDPNAQERFALPTETLQGALRHYDAALRLAPFDVEIRRERDAVNLAFIHATIPAPRAKPRVDREPSITLAREAIGGWPVHLPGATLRDRGLYAYLTGDIPAALSAWEQIEGLGNPQTEPDAFMEAALGMLYLVNNQPARAYPRLRKACESFPNVSFLTVYLADAAVQCDDPDVAERLIEAARTMSRPDKQYGLERVVADLLAVRGQCNDAIAAHRRIGSSVAILHVARLLNRLGRTDEALIAYREVIGKVPNGLAPRRLFAKTMDGWWRRTGPVDRLRLIRAMLDDAPHAEDSLLVRLRLYAESRRRLAESRSDQARKPPGNAISKANSRVATFFLLIRSPSLEKADLTALTNILEVDVMDRWARMQSYPPALKNLQFLSWRLPPLNATWRVLRDLPFLARFARRATAILMAVVAGASSRAIADPSVPAGFSMTLVAQSQPVPYNLAIAPPTFGAFGGKVFYVNPSGNSVYRVDDAGLAQLFATVPSSPQYLAFGPGGSWGTDLYVSCLQDPINTDDGRIVRIDASGAMTTFGQTNPTNYRFGGCGMTFSDGGPFGVNLYTGASAGLPGDCISRISPAGGRATLFNSVAGNLPPGTQYSGSPNGLAFGPGVEGFTTNLYFSMFGANSADTEGIFVVTSSGSRSSFLVNGGGGSHPATWLDFGHGGAFGHKLYAIQDGKLIRLDSSAVGEDFVTSPSTISTFTFDKAKALYVYENGASRLWRIVPGCTPHTGDMNDDGATNGADVQRFVAAVIASSTLPADTCPGDFDDSGVVSPPDTPGFVAALLGP